jgi:hypothetical protein
MFVAGLALGLALLPGTPLTTHSAQIARLLVRYIAAGVAATLLLRFAVPMSWVRIFAMDYVISFLLITGMICWVFGTRKDSILDPSTGLKPRASWRTLLIGVVAAAYVIIVPGLLIGSNLFHVFPSGSRWWRFPVISLTSFPLLLADEFYLRCITPRWKAHAVGILIRVLIGALMLTGVLLWNPSDAFLALVLHVVVSFWIALWFVTEAVHRNTQDPTAAAVFASLVQGWAFAAGFVIT